MPTRNGAATIAGVLLLSAWAAAQGQPGFKIVVNSSNPTTSISKAEISSLFLRRSGTWADGEAAFPVDQSEGTALRQVFSRDILGMSPANAAQQATSRGAALPALATDRDVLAYVRLKPGAIGYVSASAPAQGVKAFTPDGSGDYLLAAATRAPITVGNGVPAPAKVHDVPPVYPAVARQGRVQGLVELDIVVGEDGAVQETQVLRSSSAVLTDAAIDAVRKWRYAPTRVNGAPVPVRMTVQVNFVL
jgi:TonB family protein